MQCNELLQVSAAEAILEQDGRGNGTELSRIAE